MLSARAGLLAFALLAGCQRNVSPDTYSIGSVGQVNRATRAVVISARAVNISGTQSGLGAMTGAAAGGIGGSQIGRGGGAAAAVLAGVVIGGIAGAMAEEAATGQLGTEYVVSTENGLLMTLVQGPTPYFPMGQKVLVIYGGQSRLVAAP